MSRLRKIITSTRRSLHVTDDKTQGIIWRSTHKEEPGWMSKSRTRKESFERKPQRDFADKAYDNSIDWRKANLTKMVVLNEDLKQECMKFGQWLCTIINWKITGPTEASRIVKRDLAPERAGEPKWPAKVIITLKASRKPHVCQVQPLLKGATNRRTAHRNMPEWMFQCRAADN